MMSPDEFKYKYAKLTERIQQRVPHISVPSIDAILTAGGDEYASLLREARPPIIKIASVVSGVERRRRESETETHTRHGGWCMICGGTGSPQYIHIDEDDDVDQTQRWAFRAWFTDGTDTGRITIARWRIDEGPRVLVYSETGYDEVHVPLSSMIQWFTAILKPDTPKTKS